MVIIVFEKFHFRAGLVWTEGPDRSNSAAFLNCSGVFEDGTQKSRMQVQRRLLYHMIKFNSYSAFMILSNKY